MTEHADVIRECWEQSLRGSGDTVGAVRRGHAALDALVAERDRLKEALEQIAALPDSYYGQSISIARAALASVGEGSRPVAVAVGVNSPGITAPFPSGRNDHA